MLSNWTHVYLSGLSEQWVEWGWEAGKPRLDANESSDFCAIGRL